VSKQCQSDANKMDISSNGCFAIQVAHGVLVFAGLCGSYLTRALVVGILRGMSSFIVMGVSGCGKSTVGQLLAKEAGLPFLDADDFHPPANIEKMRSGIPLTDSDRTPWLARLHHQLLAHDSGPGCVLACSALRESYRLALAGPLPAIRWVYLRGTRAELLARLEAREEHFMPATLLDSQLALLEEPVGAMTFSVNLSPDRIVAEVLRLSPSG
jgi:carbohydrate kinase (thermoresistant glucokinase family)